MVNVNSNEINSRIQLINRLVLNTVVKQTKLAEAGETSVSMKNAEEYKNAVEMIDTLYSYTYTYMDIKVLKPTLPNDIVYGLIEGELKFEDYMNDTEMQYLLYTKRTERIATYEELNPYYRMLSGNPPLDTPTSEYIIINGKPIQDNTDIEIYELKKSGKLDTLIMENPDKPYLRYLGLNIDIYAARKSGTYEILYIPDGRDYQIYRECYSKERKSFIRTYHMPQLVVKADYREAVEIMILKMQGIIQYLIKTNGPLMDRDTFSAEEADSLFKEFGLTIPKGMPSSYRDSVCFVLNYLVVMKGTNFVLKFIVEKIFTGLKLYKYIVRKRHKIGISYPIPDGTPDDQIYDVDFVLRPYGATNIIDFKDPDRDDVILTYDEIVALDPRWGTSQELKDAVFSEKFSYVNSKYLAVDSMIDLLEFSNAFSLITRVIIENKSKLTNHMVTYNSTGVGHSFYNLWIYYLAIFTTLVEFIKVIAPDTLSSIDTLMGFRIPPNFDRVKTIWLWYLTKNEKLAHFLDEFPDAINSSTSFFQLLIHIDKAIPIANFMEEMFIYCDTFAEYDLLLEVYKMVRIVNTTPTSYNHIPDVVGKSYVDYLSENDSALYLLYEDIIANSVENVEPLIMEMDNLTQFLIDYVKSYATTQYPLTNIQNTIYDSNILIAGVSKYLMYILKLFKAYTADFITDTNIFQINESQNYQLNLCQVTPKVDIMMHLRWNVSQYDWIETPDYVDTYFKDICQEDDAVIISQHHGDVDITIG